MNVIKIVLKFQKSLFFAKLYKLLCYLYCEISTKLETYFFRGNKSSYEIDKTGIVEYKISNTNLDKLIKYKYIRDNKYKRTRFLKKSEIKKLVAIIFNDDFKNYITNVTGFKYSIDHFWFYEREKIEEKDKNRQWYAHEYHFDKPYSKNMLKIFIPIDIIDKEAALAVYDRKKSKKIKSLKNDDITNNVFRLTGESNKIFCFLPRVCWHKDGIPITNKPASQIMFQLNPSKQWNYNLDIMNKQLSMEGRFPFFTYLFKKRKRI